MIPVGVVDGGGCVEPYPLELFEHDSIITNVAITAIAVRMKLFLVSIFKD
jgi:hypothetical protein